MQSRIIFISNYRIGSFATGQYQLARQNAIRFCINAVVNGIILTTACQHDGIFASLPFFFAVNFLQTPHCAYIGKHFFVSNNTLGGKQFILAIAVKVASNKRSQTIVSRLLAAFVDLLQHILVNFYIVSFAVCHSNFDSIVIPRNIFNHAKIVGVSKNFAYIFRFFKIQKQKVPASSPVTSANRKQNIFIALLNLHSFKQAIITTIYRRFVGGENFLISISHQQK